MKGWFQMKSKLFKGIAISMAFAVVTAMSVSATAVSSTPSNQPKEAQEASSYAHVYAQYDIGSGWPNDDAFLLAVAQSSESDDKAVYAYASSGARNSTVEDSGDETYKYYVVAQLSGVDFLDSNSLCWASTDELYASMNID